MSESLILCEGYHDRAFWKGWLLYLGCTDPSTPAPGSARRSVVLDPWGTRVVAGHYAYSSRTGRFIRVVPCHGKSNVLTEALSRLRQRTTKPLSRLVINVDPDVPAGGTGPGTAGLQSRDVEARLQTIDSAAALNAAGEIDLDSGTTKVSLIRWEAGDPPTRGLPAQETLERLVSAALVAAYPPRAQAVQRWLDGRPAPPGADPKEHAWSYMAGWYAEHGCDDFYSNLWRDPVVVRELEARLVSSGAWPIVQAIAS
jgi:hypothetical protein